MLAGLPTGVKPPKNVFIAVLMDKKIQYNLTVWCSFSDQ